MIVTEIMQFRERAKKDPLRYPVFRDLIVKHVLGYEARHDGIGYYYCNPTTRHCQGNFDYEQGFANSANLDLLSHRVACGWDLDREHLYWHYLSAIFGFDAKPSLSAMRHYKIGDYSAAALAVVLDETTEKKADLYRCESCDKLTAEYHVDSEGVQLCRKCFDELQKENL